MRKHHIRLHVRLNKKQKDKLRRSSAAEGVTMSDYIRRRIETTVIPERPNIDWKGLAARVNALGEEMNEIAHRVNACGFVTKQDVAEVLRIVRAVKGELVEAQTQIDALEQKGAV